MSWQAYVDEHLMVELPHGEGERGGGRKREQTRGWETNPPPKKKTTPPATPPPPHSLPGGTLTSAAIVGQDGGVWASSPGFPDVTPEEVDALVAGLADGGEAALAAAGLHLGGVKYLMIPGDPGSVIRGKKGGDGVTVKKTSTALVVGFYGAGAQPGDATMAIENLGDYLIGQGM